jgi:hypothetical protein
MVPYCTSLPSLLFLNPRIMDGSRGIEDLMEKGVLQHQQDEGSLAVPQPCDRGRKFLGMTLASLFQGKKDTEGIAWPF